MMPPIEKRGRWLVVVVSDSKGGLAAYPCHGREPEDAIGAIENAEPERGTRYLVHYERGFETKQDAATRAQTLNEEIKGGSGGAVSSSTH